MFLTDCDEGLIERDPGRTLEHLKNRGLLSIRHVRGRHLVQILTVTL